MRRLFLVAATIAVCVLAAGIGASIARADACNADGSWPNCATECAITGNACDQPSDGGIDYGWICATTGNDCPPPDPPPPSCPDGYSFDAFGNCVANQPPVQQPPPPNCESSNIGVSFSPGRPNIVGAFVTLKCAGTPPFVGELTLKLLRADVSSAGPYIQVASDEVAITSTSPAVVIAYPCQINPFTAWFNAEADWTIGDANGTGQPGTNRNFDPLPVTPFMNGGCL